MAPIKYPPYGKLAVSIPDQCVNPAIIICSGSGGFDRARSGQNGAWCRSIKHKLVLPFRTPPESYNWPVNGYLVVVFHFGATEATGIIERLAICCLNYGATRVLDCHPDKMTRYLPQLIADGVTV